MIEGLHITTLAAEGKAMGKVDNQVVFVPMTVPGDVVDVQVRKHHRRFMEATVVRFIEKSPLRVEPFCEHFASSRKSMYSVFTSSYGNARCATIPFFTYI